MIQAMLAAHWPAVHIKGFRSGLLLNGVRIRWPANLKNLTSRPLIAPPFFQNGTKSGFEMCFDIGPQHLTKHVSNPE